ncbi:conserved protein of unknown function [Candidatus Promineifilum breve]|uniref:Uncharacterized protein n=1 Tax=Candidatus Promineifilum breve TaxID=1806508 RepID=A0A160T391_9CHLR|nr:hypothetical protein [Candidatus Promineifilum breve]CUS03438.2 conserved protein of unknown function [Candidatus Promineifilum breve]
MSNQFAICIDNSEYPASLELHKTYRVLPDIDAQADGDLRVIDESGEDYLYPTDYFVLIDVSDETARILVDSFGRGVEPA